MDKIEKLIMIRKISLTCGLLSIFINLIGVFLPNNLIIIIGISLLSIHLVLSIFFWKCPYCNRRLTMRFDDNGNNDIDFGYRCPYCNKKFN